MQICIHGEHPAIKLAGEELARYLSMMAGEEIQISQSACENASPTIIIGCGENVTKTIELPAVKDANWDDCYKITSQGPNLYITGVNPRSVLMGTYAYLRELGADWVCPGENGEVIPTIDSIPTEGFDITFLPADRHRGVCIEGAPSVEHVLDMIEWLPKVSQNSYFIQFRTSSYFYRLWYEHTGNTEWDDNDRWRPSEEECIEMDKQLVAAIKERGMLLHYVGHGWTAAAVGLPTDGWVQFDGEIDPEMVPLLAEVNGKREVFGGIPVNTELCYSKPEARERLINTLLDYVKEHPEVDALHFWLSDAQNNLCECEGCAKYSPSDWYVVLLNELTPKLKEIAPHMKIVFLAYCDLLWAPEKVELDLSNDNLIYMFAPISRCYGHAIDDPECGEEVELVNPGLNKNVMPADNRVNMQLLRLWDGVRPDDSFVYDYHYWRPCLADRLNMRTAAVITADIKAYRKGGLHGIINCSSQRAFYPNGWAYYATAMALNGEATDDALKTKYYELTYGEKADTARAFLDGFEEVTGSPLHGTNWLAEATTERVDAILAFLNEYKEAIEAAAEVAPAGAQKYAWDLLVHFHTFQSYLWSAAGAKVAGDINVAIERIDQAKTFLCRTEKETAHALDGFLMYGYLDGLKNSLKAE